MNNKPKKYTTAVLVKLDMETRLSLEFIRAVQGTSVNESIRRAVAEYLEKH